MGGNGGFAVETAKLARSSALLEGMAADFDTTRPEAIVYDVASLLPGSQSAPPAAALAQDWSGQQRSWSMRTQELATDLRACIRLYTEAEVSATQAGVHWAQALGVA